MLDPVPKLAEHCLRHIDRVLRHKEDTDALRPDEPNYLLNSRLQDGWEIVEQQVGLVEEEDQLRLLRVADLRQLLKQLTHQPQQEGRIQLWRLQQLICREYVDHAPAGAIDLQ